MLKAVLSLAGARVGAPVKPRALLFLRGVLFVSAFERQSIGFSEKG